MKPSKRYSLSALLLIFFSGVAGADSVTIGFIKWTCPNVCVVTYSFFNGTSWYEVHDSQNEQISYQYVTADDPIEG